MQKKTFEINTSSGQIQQQQQQQSEQGKAQTDLSNAFAQLLLRRNTFSTSKTYLNKPNQQQHHSSNNHHQQGFGFNHLSDRSQSIAKLNCSNIFLQNHNNQNIKQSQQQQQQQQQHQVVPNIPVSKLKAKFETKFGGECKKSATKKFGNPILFSSPKPDKKLNSPALCSLKCDLDNDEEENNANDSLSTVIPNSTEYDVHNNLFDSNNETLKTSIRDEKDIIDLDMTLNDSFIIKTDLDYLNDDDDGESFLFNIELDECPRVAQESSSSSEKSEKENDNVKELKKYKKNTLELLICKLFHIAIKMKIVFSYIVLAFVLTYFRLYLSYV